MFSPTLKQYGLTKKPLSASSIAKFIASAWHSASLYHTLFEFAITVQDFAFNVWHIRMDARNVYFFSPFTVRMPKLAAMLAYIAH